MWRKRYAFSICLHNVRPFVLPAAFVGVFHQMCGCLPWLVHAVFSLNFLFARSSQKTPLLGVDVGASSGKISGHVGLGGSGDSFYEYLVKGWVQGRRTEPPLLDAFVGAIKEARSALLRTGSGPNALRCVVSRSDGHVFCTMLHTDTRKSGK